MFPLMCADILSVELISIERADDNLVKSTPKVVPKLNDLSTATFFVRPPLILPAPLIVEGYQRPFPNINS